jgi:uncharacterized protein YjbI with pentapeptide repeats
MVNNEHYAQLKDGVIAWNEWRFKNLNIIPDFCEADLSKAKLRGVDLSGAILRAADLSNADLSNANLSKTNLRGVDLSGAILRAADLSNADLSNAKLSKTNLNNAKLNKINPNGPDLPKTMVLAIRANLSGADLREAKLCGLDLSTADLSGANLSGLDLSRFDLSGASLSRANLNGANLHGANLQGADLSRAKLCGLDFREFDFNGANLQGADLSGTNLSGLDLSRFDLSGANLQGADLSGTNLSGLDLSRFDLSGANLSGTNLSGANLSGTNLSGANLSGLDLSRFDLSGAKLSGTNLSGANLSGLDLSRFDLSGAKLGGANLSGANLSKTQALGTDFTGAKFTGACLEDWNINSATKLDNIDCQYIYLKRDKQEPRPSSGEFAPGEFTKLFQKALETVDLIFTNGIDWKAFLLSFQELQAEYGEENLSVQAIEKKNGGAFVIRLEVRPEANKAEIEFREKELYQQHIFLMEAQIKNQENLLNDYKKILDDTRKDNTDFKGLIKTLADNRPTININMEAIAESNSMSKSSSSEFDMRNSIIGNVVGTAESGSTQQSIQHNYPLEQKQSLAEAAAQIQKLLEQLEKTNPTATETDKQAFVTAAIRPEDRSRIVKALQAGGEKALEEFLKNPYVNVAIAIVKEWQKAE